MTPAAENLRVLLEARDIDGFLTAFQEYRDQNTFEPVVTALSQRVFPPLLRQAFLEERLPPSTLVRLYWLVRSGRMALVEDDLIVGINLRINDAQLKVDPDAKTPVIPLVTGDEVKPKGVRWSPAAGEGSQRVPATEMKRVAVVSAFTQAYPNVPLKNFIDIDKLQATVPVRTRNYAWSAQVDVLLCTADEDPIAGIELDSVHHDTEEAIERDELKNLLFKLAGLPLVRIRADDTKAVRAEDFYDLLMAESKTLDTLRPRRLRPRRTHDFLVPAESATRSTSIDRVRG
jgi:hypothetical protein